MRFIADYISITSFKFASRVLLLDFPRIYKSFNTVFSFKFTYVISKAILFYSITAISRIMLAY